MSPLKQEYLKESKNCLLLDVIVAPKSSRNVIIGEYQDRLKVALTAPPVDGKANKALVDFIADLANVSKKQVTVIRGMTSKKKTLEITGIKLTQLLKALIPIEK